MIANTELITMIEVEGLDYRMSLTQKVGRLGSLLPRLDILSILPCPSGRWRVLSGHPKSILTSACRPHHYPSDRAFSAHVHEGDRCCNRVSVYDAH
jgi:hypothetical protein